MELLLGFGVNPFVVAREQSPVGTIYLLKQLKRGRYDQEEWRSTAAFSPELPRIGRTTTGTSHGQTQTLTKTNSSGLDLSTGMQVLARLIPGLSDAVKVEAKAALEAAGAASCSVRLVEPSIERIRLDDLHPALAKVEYAAAFVARMNDGYIPYFCTGGWSAKALEVTAMNKDKRSVNVAAALDKILNAAGRANLSLVDGANDRKVFKSKIPLFFGGELKRVEKQEFGLRLSGYRPETQLAGAVGDTPTDIGDIWDEDADVILDAKPAGDR
ncbi:hypothetical protein GGD63_001096 [Bradyrhizobium sp. cir1]|uniref:hypothetical protein n=1 Tax=Bradyrhizobium sp. cir1 TaxID=1445730 RepID=UPI0016069D56|nr:hypothetical protein [Bradyrhizobium sp. cir1]MBB4368317.1 hypothetical protein [Bradyrhizobium sp. cir1]